MIKATFAMIVMLTSGAIAVAQPAQHGGTTPVQGPERPTAADLMGKNGGSLLRASLMASPESNKAKISSVSFYAVPEPEPKTVKKHSLVTIIIREETQYNSDGTTDLKKNADFDAQVSNMVKTGGKWPFIQGGAITSPVPQITASGTRNLKGQATVNREETFMSRITAEVVDVKPNGTFAVQARKRIKADDEEQEYTLTGMCRAEDLTPDNTVLSTQIHDLSIERLTKGAVKDTTNRGWVPKLLDFVNPF